jgi:tRNA pseudouridine38-40 synthase
MALWRVTLAYDGTGFAGWQVQAGRPRTRTVQGALEAALSRLARGPRVAVSGAGRTDTGVHALGQVASFALDKEIGPAELHRALNALLPEDVRVLEAAVAPSGFHARKSALSKLYRYELDTGPFQLPHRRRVAGHVPQRLDEGAVRSAAGLFCGRHDFASLASSGGSGSVKTTVRTVLRSEARFEDGTLVYEVEADGFLRRMVRSMVGGLVAAGRGAASVENCGARSRPDRAVAAARRGRGLTLVASSTRPRCRIAVPPPTCHWDLLEVVPSGSGAGALRPSTSLASRATWP